MVFINLSTSEQIEDDPHSSGDAGVFVLGVRNDTLAPLAGTDGDYAPFQVNADGALYVDVAAVSGGINQVEGDVAHDDVDSGNPVKIGGVARTANPTAVANADRAQFMTDDVGRLVVVQSHVRDLVTSQYTQITSASETTVLSAGGAGVYHDLTAIVMTCNKNNVQVTLRDSTAGTINFVTRLDQNTRFQLNFSPPFPQTTANNNWTVQLDSGSATLDITVIAVKNI